jgi:hypothetical protein
VVRIRDSNREMLSRIKDILTGRSSAVPVGKYEVHKLVEML